MIDKELILQVFKNLEEDNDKAKAYYDGIGRGIRIMRDNLILAIDNIKSNQENPISADKLATSAIDGIGKIKLCDKAVYTKEEPKELSKDDIND